MAALLLAMPACVTFSPNYCVCFLFFIFFGRGWGWCAGKQACLHMHLYVLFPNYFIYFLVITIMYFMFCSCSFWIEYSISYVRIILILPEIGAGQWWGHHKFSGKELRRLFLWISWTYARRMIQFFPIFPCCFCWF